MTYLDPSHVHTDSPVGSAEQLCNAIDRALFPMDATFIRAGSDPEARLRSIPVGRMSIMNFRAYGRTEVTCKRSWKHIRENNFQSYLLWFQRRGAVNSFYNGQKSLVGEDQFMITRSDSTYWATAVKNTLNEHDGIQVVVPSALAYSLCPDIDAFAGRPLPLTSARLKIARNLFLTLCTEVDADEGDAVEGYALAALKSVVESLVAKREDGAAGQSRRLETSHIISYVERHLSDPDLSVGKAAAALRVSRGYIHHILRRSGTSFSDHLWQRRFENAHAKLRDPAFQERTIAEIAFMEGFKSSAHFSRSFKRRFDISPSELRG